MTVKTRLLRILEQEDVNFFLTNRMPRRLVGRLARRFSRIEHPMVRDASIGLWSFSPASI